MYNTMHTLVRVCVYESLTYGKRCIICPTNFVDNVFAETFVNGDRSAFTV